MAGVPIAIARVGATRTFLLVVGFQMLASLVWDAALEGRLPTAARLAAVGLSLAGAAIAVLSRGP